jgi:hypothetical protein
MESAARKIDIKAVYQVFGEIVAVAPEAVRVRTSLSDVAARRAASCLLEPAVGDRVLVAVEEDGDAFVLAVLEQRQPGRTTIAVEGDLSLRSLRGTVSIAAQEGVEIVSATAARILANAVEVNALEALSVLGGAVTAELGKVKTYAASVDSFFERLSSRVKRSFRTVEEVDQVRARHIDYAASESAHFHGENALVTAHHLVKLNAEQVHVG